MARAAVAAAIGLVGWFANMANPDSGQKNTLASMFSARKAASSLSRVRPVDGLHTTVGIHEPLTVPDGSGFIEIPAMSANAAR